MNQALNMVKASSFFWALQVTLSRSVTWNFFVLEVTDNNILWEGKDKRKSGRAAQGFSCVWEGEYALWAQRVRVAHDFPSHSDTTWPLAYLSDAKDGRVPPHHSGSPHRSPSRVNEVCSQAQVIAYVRTKSRYLHFDSFPIQSHSIRSKERNG